MNTGRVNRLLGFKVGANPTGGSQNQPCLKRRVKRLMSMKVPLNEARELVVELRAKALQSVAQFWNDPELLDNIRQARVDLQVLEMISAEIEKAEKEQWLEDENG